MAPMLSLSLRSWASLACCLKRHQLKTAGYNAAKVRYCLCKGMVDLKKGDQTEFVEKWYINMTFNPSELNPRVLS